MRGLSRITDQRSPRKSERWSKLILSLKSQRSATTLTRHYPLSINIGPVDSCWSFTNDETGRFSGVTLSTPWNASSALSVFGWRLGVDRPLIFRSRARAHSCDELPCRVRMRNMSCANRISRVLRVQSTDSHLSSDQIRRPHRPYAITQAVVLSCQFVVELEGDWTNNRDEERGAKVKGRPVGRLGSQSWRTAPFSTAAELRDLASA